jgi:DnaD/phage-associated family protein
MPNRMIKDSIHESEKLNSLSDFNFRLWVHLLTFVDDYGRGDARPAIIKGNCFPLRDRVTVKDIDAGLHALADTGCIVLYEVGGKSYLYFPSWGKHQRIQTKRSRYPEPPDNNAPHSDPPSSTVSHGETPPEEEEEVEGEEEVEAGRGSARARAEAAPAADSAVSYCEACLRSMSPGNFEELRDFMQNEDLPDDLIKFAVDDACAHGARSWSYVAKILNRYVTQGIRTVEQAEAKKSKDTEKSNLSEDEKRRLADEWGGDL